MAVYDHVSDGTSVEAVKLMPDRTGFPEWASAVGLIYEEAPNGAIVFGSGRTLENGQWLVKTETGDFIAFEEAEFQLQYVAA